MFTRSCITMAVIVTLLAMLPLSKRVSAAGEPLLVIAATNFPASDISLATLKDAFGGRSATVSGKRIIPINHPLDSPARVGFDRVILGLDPKAVGRFWVDKRIRAEGTPPTMASTAELAVRIVASLANSVSYAPKAMLNSKVKALTVGGKSASDPDYPIKP